MAQSLRKCSCTILNKVSNNNRIVVIVDDDLEITLLFREALKDISRVKIFTFTDPVLALEHFQINEYAYVLVISDFKMPGLNGMEFSKKDKGFESLCENNINDGLRSSG